MIGRIVSDWSRVDMTNANDQQKVRGALQHFLTGPVKKDAALIKAGMQHFATSGDFPASVIPLLEKYHLTTNFDNTWQEIFKTLDLRTSKRNSWSITDVQSGLSFNVVKTGEKAKIYKMSGTKVEVSMDLYGGGLGWSKLLFDDEEYWTIEDNAIEFRNKQMSTKAQNHYDLIDAIGAGIDLTWQAVEPAAVAAADKDYNAIRDINTINKACENILLAVKDKGYGASPSSPFIILAPIQLIGRINRALAITQQAFSGSTQRKDYNVSPRYSMMLSASDKYYVCLPKLKCQSGNRMDMQMFGQFDITSYTEIAVAWERYGAAIGDTDQFQRCATA